MKVILIVPDEGYYDRTWWMLFWAYLRKSSCALNLICIFFNMHFILIFNLIQFQRTNIRRIWCQNGNQNWQSRETGNIGAIQNWHIQRNWQQRGHQKLTIQRNWQLRGNQKQIIQRNCQHRGHQKLTYPEKLATWGTRRQTKQKHNAKLG